MVIVSTFITPPLLKIIFQRAAVRGGPAQPAHTAGGAAPLGSLESHDT